MNTIKIRRGTEANLPTLEAGELGFTTDTKKVYVGDGTDNHLVTGITKVEDDPNPKAGGEFDFQAHSAGFTLQEIAGNGAITIDWRNGNKAKVTLSADTTLSFTNPTKPCSLLLEVVQDSTGGWTLTLPTIKWAGGVSPALSTAANNISVISLLWDGSNYLGEAGYDFA